MKYYSLSCSLFVIYVKTPEHHACNWGKQAVTTVATTV